MSTESSKKPLPITVEGVTYDASGWVNKHPGGFEILENYRNRDATDVFMVMHSQGAVKTLKSLPKIEKTVPPQPEKCEPQEDFRKLREELIATGMFNASPVWYTYKIVTTLGLGAVGYYLMAATQWYFVGAVFLGMHFQQMGWLSHDICHHQVFQTRQYGNLIGVLFGNVMQGFSVTWWKDRHNAHHSATNVQGHDPDIDNLPLLAWSKEDIEVASPATRRLLRWQPYYFFAIAALLRLIWCFQSILTVRALKDHKTNSFYRSQYTREAIGLALHWSLKALFYFWFMPTFLTGMMCFWVSELIGGFGIAIVVFMNHYPLEKIRDSKWDEHGFAAGQIYETMNVKRGFITDWFFGGLNYQIEHHLWPTLPRHSLKPASYRVEELCRKHNLPYRAPDPIEGTAILVQALSKFGQMAVAYNNKAQEKRKQ